MSIKGFKRNSHQLSEICLPTIEVIIQKLLHNVFRSKGNQNPSERLRYFNGLSRAQVPSQLPSGAQFEGHQFAGISTRTVAGVRAIVPTSACNAADVCLQCHGNHLVSKCQKTSSGDGKPVTRNSSNNQAIPRSSRHACPP